MFIKYEGNPYHERYIMSETTEPVAPTTTEPVQGADSPEEKGILRDLQAERAKRQALTAELDAIKLANEEAETARLAEQNKFEELYNSEKAKVAELEPEVAKFRTANEAKKTALLEKLGEDADSFKTLDVPALEKVVEKLTKVNLPAEPGQPGATPSGNFGGYETKLELAEAVAKGVPGAREAYDRL